MLKHPKYALSARAQASVFEIAASITDSLKFGDESGRRLMFPQVLGIVRRYVETRVTRVGDAVIEEIALEPYRSTIASRVAAAIRPAAEEGSNRCCRSCTTWRGSGRRTSRRS